VHATDARAAAPDAAAAIAPAASAVDAQPTVPVDATPAAAPPDAMAPAATLPDAAPPSRHGGEHRRPREHPHAGSGSDGSNGIQEIKLGGSK
jgi:hypothetical protein